MGLSCRKRAEANANFACSKREKHNANWGQLLCAREKEIKLIWATKSRTQLGCLSVCVPWPRLVRVCARALARVCPCGRLAWRLIIDPIWILFCFWPIDFSISTRLRAAASLAGPHAAEQLAELRPVRTELGRVESSRAEPSRVPGEEEKGGRRKSRAICTTFSHTNSRALSEQAARLLSQLRRPEIRAPRKWRLIDGAATCCCERRKHKSALRRSICWPPNGSSCATFSLTFRAESRAAQRTIKLREEINCSRAAIKRRRQRCLECAPTLGQPIGCSAKHLAGQRAGSRCQTGGKLFASRSLVGPFLA